MGVMDNYNQQLIAGSKRVIAGLRNQIKIMENQSELKDRLIEKLEERIGLMIGDIRQLRGGSDDK
jgi:hypothetical protein